MFNLLNLPQGLAGGVAPPAQQEAPVQEPQPVGGRGMFGVRGNLRDILGVVGDAFLLQSGNRPLYAPVRERERMGRIMSGYKDNPAGTIEQLRLTDPELASKLHRDYLKTQGDMQDADMAAAKELRDAAAHQDKTFGIAARMLGTANKNNWGSVRSQIQQYLSARGVDSPVDLPEQYDEESVNRIRSLAVPVEDQQKMADQQDYRDEYLQIQRQGVGLKASEAGSRNRSRTVGDLTKVANVYRGLRNDNVREDQGNRRLERSGANPRSGKTITLPNGTVIKVR